MILPDKVLSLPLLVYCRHYHIHSVTILFNRKIVAGLKGSTRFYYRPKGLLFHWILAGIQQIKANIRKKNEKTKYEIKYLLGGANQKHRKADIAIKFLLGPHAENECVFI